VVGVTICNFNLWTEQDERGRFKVPMLSRWRMQEQHSGERGLPQVKYAFLELPKYAAGDAPETLIDRWAYFFREATNLSVVPPALEEGPFRAALEVARTATFTSAEWEAYERAKMAEQDARGALAVARQEGLTEGHRVGLAEGHAEGKREALLRLLARRGIVLPEDARARIAACVLEAKLPRYPMPVALIGRLAIDARAQGRRLGETLLLDALRRVVDAAGIVGCTGIIVDAKDDAAEGFYAKYDFVTVSADTWPHRMFLPIATAKAAFGDP